MTAKGVGTDLFCCLPLKNDFVNAICTVNTSTNTKFEITQKNEQASVLEM
jgi:hypothetical protein